MRLTLSPGLVRLVLAGILLAATATAGALDSAAIDAFLERAQRAAGVEPAPVVDDAGFLRRLSLDVRGIVPSVEETIEFLTDPSPHKRADWTARLLDSPERGAHWAAYWDKVLIGTLEQPSAPEAQYAIKSRWRAWATGRFNDNVSWDEFMRETVSARGRTDQDPETLPLARWRMAPENMAGTMSRAFLGSQIQCAQCHDHKTNPALTQRKFWEFAAFFGNTRVVPVRDEMSGRLRAEEVIDGGVQWRLPIPDLQPRTTVEPRYLDGTAARRRVVDQDGKPVDEATQRAAFRSMADMRRQAQQAVEAGDPAMIAEMIENRDPVTQIRDTRREQLADMIVERDRERFAANFVNRLWARLFGRGFVEPVDAWDEGVEPIHPELLAALTADFLASGMDIKALEAKLLATKAYQRASRPTATSADAPELFAHAALRPLTPDQLLASVVAVTRMQSGGALGGEDRDRLDRLRLRQAAQFVHVFGNDEMEWTSTFEPSIPRALYLMNDDALFGSIQGRTGTGILQRIREASDEPAEQVEYLYLAALSRRPTTAERVALAGELRAATSRRDWQALMEDALWALLNSTEFLMNR